MAKTIHATSTLIGTIIGAGIFGIPFVVMKSGITIGLINIIVIAILILITMLYLGEIALRTNQNHQLTGYAEKYLGAKGKILMLFAMAFGIYAAVLAYLIGTGESLSFLFFNSTSHVLQFGILFWILMSIISYFGLKALEEGEFLGVSIIIILVIAISFFFANKIDLSNLAQQNSKSIKDYFAPFGVIFFAFLGYTTIPEVKRILKNHKKEMKRSIISAIIICTIIYTLFTLIVIGFKGTDTPQVATIALGKPFIFLGILTMMTSYLALSIALMDIFQLDFNQTKSKSWFYTISVPIIFFILLELLNAAHFTNIIGLGGVITGGISTILILFMMKKAKYLGDRKPEYSIPASKLLTWILMILIVLGTIGEIIYTL